MDIFEYIFSDEFMGRIKTILLVVVILLVVILAITIPLSNPVKIADVEGEISEIRELDIVVLAKHVNYLEKGQVVDNPINVSAGICFNEINPFYRCDVGKKVRLTKWVNVWGEWWFQEAIIEQYSGNETFLMPIR